jgi:hypothetical protein
MVMMEGRYVGRSASVMHVAIRSCTVEAVSMVLLSVSTVYDGCMGKMKKTESESTIPDSGAASVTKV